ncbi:family 78 glycoside hydrolase catalytic domain [Roseateles sp. DC23W]|uniref:alpha-L-rhamnosidase n=1 Tax=Pelomonas dachongensis TaxID=3299029 RepID=A0ABW7EUB4_9BURK
MSQAVNIQQLRCEYLVEPLGIDEPHPRLSWLMLAERRGARQQAWRVLVASSASRLHAGEGDLWDSGRIEGAASTHIAYAGLPLTSRQACHWQVQVWDELGVETRSAPSFWSMGLLAASDWQARWLAAPVKVLRRDPDAATPTLKRPGTPTRLRREFELPGAIRRATLHASARGVFELRANGRRIGQDMLAPEWTDYDKRIHYRSYDVTALLAPGRNALAATLGDGWWSGFVGWQKTRARYGSHQNSLLVQLEVELENGQRFTLVSDGAWTVNTGPILSSDFMMGEVYDARREQPGWDRPGFDDQGALPWLPALEVVPPPVPLVAQRSEPVRITEHIAPVSLHEAAPGVHVFDLGQNIAGWVRLRVRAAAGTRVTLRFGERLNPDGTLYTANLRRAKATDVYICKGGGEDEVYEPHFTFHGFQFVELSGLPQAPTLATVTGCVLRSATPEAGHFECSHPGVNRLWLNGLWSQKDNFLSVPTDCPQRDERLGWLGDAQVFLRTATYNMDVAAFFSKWMVDIEDAQTPEGVFPDTAPRLREGKNFTGLGNLGGAAGWADGGVSIPHTIWQVYGDRRILERHYPAMVKWVDWIASHNPGGLRAKLLSNNYGDWLCIPADTSFGTQSPMKTLLATAYWADDCAKLAEIARELGHDDDARRFNAMFERVRAAFQKTWLTPDGRITTETQTGYLLALAFDLLPEPLREAATAHLVANIEALGGHLSTGFIGIRHLNPQLTLAGRNDVAYRLLLRDDYPSWLYPVRHGATTIWERWNGWTEEDGFFNPHMNSFNHYSLGSVGEWLFRHVAGIELDPEHPGFQQFVLRPFVGEGLDFARASYRTMHGLIHSEWRLDSDRLSWQVSIPANTRAKVFVPCSSAADVTEGGTPVRQAEGLRVLGEAPGRLVCEALSGSYSFSARFHLASPEEPQS